MPTKSSSSDESNGKRVKFVCDFWDEKWSRNRSVTDVNWSYKVVSPLIKDAHEIAHGKIYV